MNAHRLAAVKELHGEVMLHQRLASAEREAAGHDLEDCDVISSAVVVFATLTGKPLVMVQAPGS